MFHLQQNKNKPMTSKLASFLYILITLQTVLSQSASIANCTCDFYTQPLDHFSLGGEKHTYSQRYCLNRQYESANSPIFFYAGNESPLEVYINHTGLMWELAPKHEALIVFAEHRYEGKSIPTLTEDCMSYSSSAQALQDYAGLLSFLNPKNTRPVIVFGGSYGGMLAAWMRMKYPSSVAGAIAASAPIWGFPLTVPALDGAWVAVSRGLTASTEGESRCFDNLLASWSLILEYGKTERGRAVLTKAFDLCSPLETGMDVFKLVQWAQDPWFALAEGDFPFPSNYITGALEKEGDEVFLPAWPMRRACEAVNKDYGIEIVGDKTQVKYSIHAKSLKLDIDWDQMTSGESYTEKDLDEENGAKDLFVGVKDAISIWYNVTKDKKCYEVGSEGKSGSKLKHNLHKNFKDKPLPLQTQRKTSDSHTCENKIHDEGCWQSLNCNESWNLIIYYTKGMGRDFFWPPSHNRDAFRDSIIRGSAKDLRYGCIDPNGQFGYPEEYDVFSNWLDDYYGGLRIGMHSNIVFSNGLLDPWSAGGVFPDLSIISSSSKYNGPMVQNITEDGSIISLILDEGAHHLDLMFSSPDDPECAAKAREIEDEHIGRWIRGWRDQICVGEVCDVRV